MNKERYCVFVVFIGFVFLLFSCTKEDLETQYITIEKRDTIFVHTTDTIYNTNKLNRTNKENVDEYINEIYITKDYNKTWDTIYISTIWNNYEGSYRIVLANNLTGGGDFDYVIWESPTKIETPINIEGIYMLVNWDKVPKKSTAGAVVNKEVASSPSQNPICYTYYIRDLERKTKDTPMFSLIDDDFSNVDMCKQLADYCEELNIRCTFALIPDYNEDPYTPSLNDDKLSLVKSLQERGFSFAIHPNHEIFYRDEEHLGTVEECEKCLVRTKQFFIEKGITGSNILVWPGSSDTREKGILVPMIKRHVSIGVHAGTLAGENFNTIFQFDRWRMRRQPLSYKHYTKTEMKDIIDKFVDGNEGLMIFTTHVWECKDDMDTLDENSLSFANLKEIINYAANKGIPFVNMEEAYQTRIQPMYISVE